MKLENINIPGLDIKAQKGKNLPSVTQLISGEADTESWPSNYRAYSSCHYRLMSQKF